MYDFRIYVRSVIKLVPPIRYLRRKRFNSELGSRSGAEKAIDKFMDSPLSAGIEREALVEDMIRMSKDYRYGYDEYFLYHFPDKTDSERLEFVADLDRIDIVETMNRAINEPIFDDKARTYAKYKTYYGRALLSCGGGYKDIDKLKRFICEYKRIFIKPADSSCGQGARILDLQTIDDLDKVLEETIRNNSRGLIAEELIVQDEQMAKLHPQSVNTLRVTTIRLNDRVKVIHPFLKIGRNDSVVDNGGAGGILCSIDLDTGLVTHTGDENGKVYRNHPETGVSIIGFQIPRWDEAVSLVKELAMITPSNRYTGWDIALTKKGWVLVEANARGQFIGWQLTTQIGFKKEICSILSEISERKFRKVLAQMQRE